MREAAVYRARRPPAMAGQRCDKPDCMRLISGAMQKPRPRFPYVQRRHRVGLLSLRLWLRHMLFWGGAVIVGLAATAFALSSDRAHALFRQVIATSPWLPLLVTPLTLAAVAALTQRFFKGAEGSGIPQTIAAIRMPEEIGRA